MQHAVADVAGGNAVAVKACPIRGGEVCHGKVSAEPAITKADGTVQEIETDKTIIATGSKPVVPAHFNYDKKRVITSTEALNIQEVPKSMVIIGAGVIGLELGSVYARLGTKIHVIEFMDRIIAGMDSDCSKELQRSLKGLGWCCWRRWPADCQQLPPKRRLVPM